MFITIFYYFDFIKMYKYNKLLNSIKNKKIKKAFSDMTSDNYLNWDKNIYETFDTLSKTCFNDFELKYDRFSKLLFLSEPETWIFFIEDIDFHKYIEKFDFSNLYMSNHNENFKIVLDLLLDLYPDKFKLDII